MLHDLVNDGGFVALKQAVKDREGWRHRGKMSKTQSMAEDILMTMVVVVMMMMWDKRLDFGHPP